MQCAEYDYIAQAFEDNIRKNRSNISNWLKYAQWEESLKEVQRARSVYERALDVEHRNVTIWLKYAEMEMRLIRKLLLFYFNNKPLIIYCFIAATNVT